MPTFKNTSDTVFQDGDLIVKPGESFLTEEESRVVQMRDQYAWQFSESKAKDAPTEAEVKEDAPAKGVRPSVGDSYVEVDADASSPRKLASQK